MKSLSFPNFHSSIGADIVESPLCSGPRYLCLCGDRWRWAISGYGGEGRRARSGHFGEALGQSMHSAISVPDLAQDLEADLHQI